MSVFGFFSKKKETPEVSKEKEIEFGLQKTKLGFAKKISKLLVGKSKVDDDFLDNLEEILISSDVGVETTLEIIERLKKRVKNDRFLDVSELNTLLKEEIKLMLPDKKIDFNLPKEGPYVILVVGVNGVGKTTTIAKLAHYFKTQDKSVVLGAADTFRAAAVDQLKIWAERVGVPIVEQGMSVDPASVAYNCVQFAKSKKIDIAIIDTAGRLHNKVGLMNELSKIKRSIAKVFPGAPHEILLVLDGSTGQNAFEQAKQFTASTETDALAVTKLDGTAKGGVIIGISHQFNIPVKYIGVGEGIEHLKLFDKTVFIDAVFN